MSEPTVRDYAQALSSLLGDEPRPLRDVILTDISQDSRTVVRGGAFLACQGRRSHGLAHLATALARGASAVLWEPAPVATPTMMTRCPAVPENVNASKSTPWLNWPVLIWFETIAPPSGSGPLKSGPP